MKPSGRPELSIVTTMYRSSAYLREFHRRITAVASRLAASHEIIFVNDGSPDDSLAVARALRSEDPRVAVLDLSRNFGHHKAMATGLAHCRGERVFLIDCDLEEAPEWLERFWRELSSRPDTDVVYGVQAERHGPWFDRATGAIFWRLFNLLTGTRVALNPCTVRIMTRRYVRQLIRFGESEFFFAGVAEIAGFGQAAIPVDKIVKGSTTYTLRRRISQFVTAVTSFSAKPMWFIGLGGSVLCALSFAFGAAIVYQKAVYGVPISGWASLIVSLWLLGGLTLGALGVIGVYIAKIFHEVKRRPFSVVRSYEPARAARSGSSDGDALKALGV